MMLKRFISYYKPHKTIFALDMLATFLVAALGICYPVVTRKMINEYIPDKNLKMILIFAGVLVAVYVTKMLLNYFIQYYGHVMGVRMQAQMRTDMFTHLEKLPYSYFDNHETGKIMSRMTNDLMDISELAHHGPENILISSLSIVISFVYLSTINVWLTLIIFACVPFLLIISMSLRQKMRSAFKDARVSIAEINASVESSVSGIRVTKAFNNALREHEKFEQGNAKFVLARDRGYKAMGQFHSGTTFVTDIFNVIVLIAGGLFLYKTKDFGFGDFSAFMVSVNLFVAPLMTLINFMEMYQNGVTGFERFCEIMDAEPEKDLPDAKDAGILKGDIEFKNVDYSYETTKDVLQGLDLKIARGTKFALVGPSGGGKTTICHLLPAFYKPEKGEIMIDGVNINEFTMSSLRRNIGIVQQDVFLFNTSVRDNILYGRLDATDEEVVEAAKKANIHEFIMSLPDGYDTNIGERGIRLSGGQRQRLSIARVFLKNPPILILDEATSALDNTTEILIQEELDALCEGRTTIVVAHRLSTVKSADEIAVIAGGKVTEQGSHDELVKLGETYKELYELQFKNR